MNYKPLARSLVHKEKNANVLLSNARRILPQAIDEDLFRRMMAVAPDERREMLKDAYIPQAVDSIFGPSGTYLSREAMGALHLSAVEYESLIEALPDERVEDLRASYSRFGEDWYTLTRPLSDDLLNRVIKLGDKREFYMDNKLQAVVAELLEPLMDADQKRDVFFANLLVDSSHPFFFEHPNEHVPGIMILEATRQMIIACAHLYGNVPMKEGQMILDLLEARFTGYMELYAPIVLRAEVVQKRISRGAWASVSLEISLHQSGSRMGVVTCGGSYIGAGLFRRIRRMKRDELNTLPFFPESDLSYTFLLKSSEGRYWREARIRRMNLRELILEEDVQAEEPGGFDFVLLIPSIGTVKGLCLHEDSDADNRLRISEIDKSDGERFELILKRYCKVPEEALL